MTWLARVIRGVDRTWRTCGLKVSIVWHSPSYLTWLGMKLCVMQTWPLSQIKAPPSFLMLFQRWITKYPVEFQLNAISHSLHAYRSLIFLYRHGNNNNMQNCKNNGAKIINIIYLLSRFRRCGWGLLFFAT